MIFVKSIGREIELSNCKNSIKIYLDNMLIYLYIQNFILEQSHF